MRAALHQHRRGGDQIIMPLELGKARDQSDDEICRGQPKLSAEVGIGLRGQKGFQSEAAVYAGELLWAANTGSQVLLSHGVGHADKVSRATRRATLSGAEELVGEGVLKSAKRRTMDSVDDDGNTCAACCQPAQNSGLAAVGVY